MAQHVQPRGRVEVEARGRTVAACDALRTRQRVVRVRHQDARARRRAVLADVGGAIQSVEVVNEVIAIGERELPAITSHVRTKDQRAAKRSLGREAPGRVVPIVHAGVRRTTAEPCMGWATRCIVKVVHVASSSAR